MIDNDKIIILKRLYLDNGMEKNSVDIYKKHLIRLSVLELKTLKLLYAIYSEIQLNIKNCLSDDLLKFYENNLDISDYENDRKYRTSRYNQNRMLERDVSRFLNSNWIDNLKNVTIELGYYYNDELIDIFIKCNVMKDLIETYITLKDEYWLPSNLKIIKNIELLGYDISEKKERIWQPKS